MMIGIAPSRLLGKTDTSSLRQNIFFADPDPFLRPTTCTILKPITPLGLLTTLRCPSCKIHTLLTCTTLNVSPRCIFNDKKEGEEVRNNLMNDEINESFQTLKIFYVNINGLTKQKIQHTDLIADTNNADIICFTETHIKYEEEAPVINNYAAYHALVNRNKYTGRNIKGISIYFKENLDTKKTTKVEELVNEKGNLVILKITNTKWTVMNELFLIVCYKEDRESKYKTENYFDNIQQHMIDQKMRHIILIGDLNGRIGKMNDNTHLKLKYRKSDDSIINGPGKEIIKFCNETSLIIANGRLDNGNCTFFTLYKNEVKKSLIDYLITSENLFNSITEFKIREPVPYTDHAPMHIAITQNIRVCKIKWPTWKVNSNKKKIYPFKWTGVNERNFRKEEFKSDCELLIKNIHLMHKNNNDIFNFLMQNKNKAVLQEQNQPQLRNVIYSETTRKSRQQYKQSVVAYKAANTIENLISLLKNKKELNKKLKIERRQKRINKLNDLSKAKAENDSRKYWQLINQTKKKKQKSEAKISARDFKTQIEIRDKQMNKSLQTADDEFMAKNNLQNEDPDNILNSDITIEEVSKTLKSMKNSKSSGPDGFVNEILKNNFEVIVPILTKIFNNIQNEDRIPWNSSWILPIHKAGNKKDVSSYRCINLSSCVEKLLTKIINNRLTKWFSKWEILNIEQTGFKKGNSVIDNVLLLKEVMQIYKNQKMPLYVCFLVKLLIPYL